jgi:hypothetical protein
MMLINPFKINAQAEIQHLLDNPASREERRTGRITPAT